MASTSGGADPHDQPASYCPSCDRAFPVGTAHCPDDGTELVVLGGPDPLIDQLIAGRFKILRKLGSGAMGVVYEALQTSLGRRVAIKVIRQSDPAAERRFLREAKLASLLSHPNIVTVYDFGKAEDRLYIAMELLDGPLLSEVLEQGGAMTPARAVAIGEQLCLALNAAHARGIVHRDLKPGNVILIDVDGHELVKVLDFGLAKTLDPEQTSVSGPRQVVGTPSYMAPEVVLGGGYTSASDLYALGVLLYALVAGRRPFPGGDPVQLFRMHVHEPVPALPDGAPAALQRVIYRLLAKDARDRFADAAATRAALLAAVDAGGARLGGAAEAVDPEPSYSLVVETPTVSLHGPKDPFALAGLRQAGREAAGEVEGRRWLLPLLIALVLAAAAGGWVLLRGRGTDAGPADEPNAAPAPPPPAPRAPVAQPVAIPDAGVPVAPPPAPAKAKPERRSHPHRGHRDRGKPAGPAERFMEPP
ncbi:MAG TPA: serine/threonine-protein kinase [Kofleriaceae bacterium]|nr:serine/threonine-protein kinase [Kofleriaceae bacterium]